MGLWNQFSKEYLVVTGVPANFSLFFIVERRCGITCVMNTPTNPNHATLLLHLAIKRQMLKWIWLWLPHIFVNNCQIHICQSLLPDIYLSIIGKYIFVNHCQIYICQSLPNLYLSAIAKYIYLSAITKNICQQLPHVRSWQKWIDAWQAAPPPPRVSLQLTGVGVAPHTSRPRVPSHHCFALVWLWLFSTVCFVFAPHTLLHYGKNY